MRTILVGDRLGPYEILSLIGQGGMGEVWKAADTRLGRIVAIKRLKSAHTARFEHEARAIAALNHPHICQIFDVGPDYLVLEFVEGVPLCGPLPAEQTQIFALQIAGALEAAHKRGILHRDLKPANVMVAEAGVKLLDFGLAKLTADSDTDGTRSLEGSAPGTAMYMCPEQAQGQQLDARSDIFSFGAMLYELISGRCAFSGGCLLEILNAVVHSEPVALDSPLWPVVKRCLAKDPSRRFQSAAELKAALAQAPAGPESQTPSIAILPFTNMSGDKENEYFSNGLAEELLNLLANIPGLRVIARTSSFAFRGREQDIRKIGDALDVRTILEGSVRRSGSRIRVTAQLINAKDGAHLWSERYDRQMTEVFELQDEIAAAIADALKVKLAIQPASARYTPRLDAYEAYLKARYWMWQLTPESLPQAREFYELAIGLDPKFALAHSGYADYFLALSSSTMMPAHEAAPLMRAEAQKALDLDPSLPEGHAMLAAVACIYDYDWSEAERQCKMAMASDPVPPLVRDWYAQLLFAFEGTSEEALAQSEYALRGDPLNPMFHCTRSVHLQATGRYGEAEAERRRALELNPNLIFVYCYMLGCYLSRGMEDQELASAEKFHSVAPQNPIAIGYLAGMVARTRDMTRSRQLLSHIESAHGYAHPLGLSIYYILTSDLETAADWMEHAIEQRVPQVAVQRVVPIYEPLHASRRWPALAKMMNLPEGMR